MSHTDTSDAIRILLLDDEASVVSALKRTLRAVRPHWEVETFTLPADALRRAQTSLFDAFVSDFRMPGMNGAEFLNASRESQPEAVRVVLSGQLDVPDIVSAVNHSRIDRLVLKPTSADELAAIIDSALEVRHIRVENRRLADQVRQQQAMLARQQSLLDDVASRHPELLRVTRDADGAIVLDAWE